MNDELLQRASLAIRNAPNGIDGDPIGVNLAEPYDTPDRAATATAAICEAAAKAVLSSIRPGDRLIGDLVAQVEEGAGRTGMTNGVAARVTGYDDDTLPSVRIDEIVLTGEIHLEMLDERYAFLGVGDNRFQIGIDRGRLIVKAEDCSFDTSPGSPSETEQA